VGRDRHPDDRRRHQRRPSLPASAVIFGTIPPGLVTDWHPSPFRGLVITLSGEAEHEAGDGTRRRFGPGSIFLAEDTTGQGHRTRSHTSQPSHGLIVSLSPAPNPQPLPEPDNAAGTKRSASASGNPGAGDTRTG
jgi:quercetin dioxygenase-like cupin family protein